MVVWPLGLTIPVKVCSTLFAEVESFSVTTVGATPSATFAVNERVSLWVVAELLIAITL
ncbi:unannotated protein [freshwater metagenome]|uniref:Unannotated protein n=1 Tax=freshwater metagenome TaxID=449393 RepID=A0A6J6EKW0_9ZZZZ